MWVILLPRLFSSLSPTDLSFPSRKTSLTMPFQHMEDGDQFMAHRMAPISPFLTNATWTRIAVPLWDHIMTFQWTWRSTQSRRLVYWRGQRSSRWCNTRFMRCFWNDVNKEIMYDMLKWIIIICKSWNGQATLSWSERMRFLEFLLSFLWSTDSESVLAWLVVTRLALTAMIRWFSVVPACNFPSSDGDLRKLLHGSECWLAVGWH